jgi:hypothetical protein
VLGASLREIVCETSLGLQTVRTIIGKADGSDRTNRQRNELRKLELNRARINAWRARKRTRDALAQADHRTTGPRRRLAQAAALTCLCAA